jgi:hypothetical protein
MYNMNISVFGFVINLEYLILIGIIYLIMAIHTIGGCCNIYGLKESLENMTKQTKSKTGMTNLTQHMPAPAIQPSSVHSGTKKEGFVGANTNYGESSAYSLTSPDVVDTSTWGSQNLTVVDGKPISSEVQSILNRPNQSLPLPEGQLSLFDNMPFSPECCPNTYSSSMGCACMNPDTYNYLISRGMNNVPYSEY